MKLLASQVNSFQPLLPSRYAQVEDKVLGLACEVDAHNFSGTSPDRNLFYGKITNFITQAREGHVLFGSKEFNVALGDISHEYHFNQRVYSAGKYDRRHDLVKIHLPTKGKVLDYGAGDGGFASFLDKSTPLEVSMCDVLDWRSDTTKELPFYLLEDNNIPAKNNEFDTVVLMYVLHHIDPVNLPKVLSEVRRVTKKNIIVVEDTFGVSRAHLKNHCRISNSFVSLPTDDQLSMIAFRDYLRNIVMYGVKEMNMPFEFKTVDEWEICFAKNGLVIDDTNIVGFNSAYNWSNNSFNVVFNLTKA